MPQFAVDRPFDERDLHHHLRPHPVRPDAWQSDGFRERACGISMSVQPRAQLEQQFRVEAGADLAREDEVLPFEVADAAARRARRVLPADR